MTAAGPARDAELSAVVVQWGDPAPLAELLDAWPDDPRYELVVVDNGGPDGPLPAATAAAVRTRGRLLAPGRNLGFAGGANAGAAAAAAPLVLFLNPDARPAPGALAALLAGFAEHPEAAGLAPRLVGPGGAPQHAWQLRRLPGAARLLAQTLFLPTGGGADAEPPPGSAVEQPAAAALALRRSAFAAAGGFDAGFRPAWFEDVDLAARLAARGDRILYHPAALFHHRLGSTVGTLGYGRFLWIYQRNLVRYLRRHHGRLAAAAARALLPAGLVARLALLPLRRPRRAPGRAAAAAGLGGALAGALTGWRRPWRWAAEAPAGEAALPTGPPAAPAEPPALAVCIVTRDAAPDVPACFSALAALEHRPLEVVVADCASSDATVAVLEREAPRLHDAGIPVTLLPLADNRGFAGGMNAALAHTRAPWVLTLNADALPAPDYPGRLLERARRHPELRVGAVTGRLVRPEADGPRRLDACGMRLTRTWRHLDRGSGEPDHGQWAAPERVFGATGAASLFRRAALDDVALGGEVFDARFHSFREDAELCFRLRERGWEVVYEPAAQAVHRRANLPERRRRMPAEVNFHSLKNRYLLRLVHQTPGNLVRTLVPTAARDLAALAYVLLRERTSLPAYGWLWRRRREILARRRAVQARRRVPPAAIDRWFGRAGEPL